MNYYLFQIIPPSTIEEIEEELKKKGLKDLYVIEDDSTGEILIGGRSTKKIESEKLLLLEKKTQSTINWEEQWSLFAEDFKEGKAHIHLTPEKTLLLTPGAGFGDLSHPTTFLMLEMMKTTVKAQSIIDIGTGSGILALAALMLGAHSAIGIDIDHQAIAHARKNAKLNHLNATFSKTLPQNIPETNIILMNMIIPEQKQCAPHLLNPYAKLWIVSGILKQQREEYLLQTAQWGWTLYSEQLKSDWLGFIFKIEGTSDNLY